MPRKKLMAVPYQAVIPPSDGAMRLCVRCQTQRPVENFPDASNHCARCQSLAKLSDRRKEDVRMASRQIVAEARRDKINVPHICELTAELLETFGSLREFCREWKSQIDEAGIANPGSRTVLDQYYAVAKLVKMSTENRASAPDLQDLTDEQIADVIAEYTLKVFEDVPEDETKRDTA